MNHPDQLGGMEILGALSRGGMGAVLLARRKGAHGFEKIVAVKTIRPDLEDREDIRSLFLDEARLAAVIEHPAIAQVHDFGEEGGTLFLAMEYVAGVSLRKLLNEVHHVPPGIAVQLGAAICRGLHAAHETVGTDGRLLGVVHRDISPSNVMLTFSGGVKILDFGIALTRERQAPDTEVGQIRGKLAYAAPEQLAGEALDRRTDVYGVANLVFELVTGRRLRAGIELASIGDSLDDPLAGVELPAPLAPILARGLARERSLRPVDARAMAIEFEDARAELGGESLEEYALSTLAEPERQHRVRIAALVGETVPPKRRGPTQVEGGPAATIAMRPDASVTAPWGGATAPVETSAPSTRSDPGAPRTSRRRWLAWGAGVGAALAGVIVARRWNAPDSPGAAREARAGVSASSDTDIAEVRPGRDAPDDSEHAARSPDSASDDDADRSRAEARRLGSSAADEAPPAEVDERRVVDDSSPNRARRRRRRSTGRKPTGTGFLTVGAHPFALVVIDGREHGLTPLVRVPLDAGRHTVRYLDPTTREVRAVQKVTVEAGAEISRVLK